MLKFKIFPFCLGLLVGAIGLPSAFAAGLVPAWKKAGVTPIVFVTHTNLYGFQEIAKTGPLVPSWTKEQVKAVVVTKYTNLYNFVPLNSESAYPSLGPQWKQADVTPWTEVACNSNGVFVTLRAE